MRWQFLYEGRLLPAFRAVDTVTDPEYRGKGIFRLLTLQLIEELKTSEPPSFIFNTPNKMSRPGYLKMGWQVLGRAPVYARWVPLAGRFNHSYWLSLEENIRHWQPDDTLPKVDDTGLIQVPKSSDYLQWRYVQCPVPEYGLEVLHHDNTEYHFFVKLKQYRYVRELRVCDVWNSGPTDWHFVARAAAQLARKAGCGMVSVMPCPGREMVFIRQGYVSLRPLANIITVRDINMGSEFEVVRDKRSWSFRTGDLELF
jgi:hypothetical protein